MVHHFDVVIEKDRAGYYVAHVPALPGCHTQARSLDELTMRSKKSLNFVSRNRGRRPRASTSLEYNASP